MNEKEIIIELHRSGFRPHEIARKLCISTADTRAVIVSAGRKLESRGAKPGHSGSVSRLGEHLLKLYSLCSGGMSASEALAVIGVDANPQYVAKLVRKHGRENGVTVLCRC